MSLRPCFVWIVLHCLFLIIKLTVACMAGCRELSRTRAVLLERLDVSSSEPETVTEALDEYLALAVGLVQLGTSWGDSTGAETETATATGDGAAAATTGAEGADGAATAAATDATGAFLCIAPVCTVRFPLSPAVCLPVQPAWQPRAQANWPARPPSQPALVKGARTPMLACSADCRWVPLRER